MFCNTCQVFCPNYMNNS
ncbi:hypothetical protein IAE19_10275 [Acinetobacter sp. S40]|nr:hypothetical protein [Acinetobacter sp. S40]MBK0063606.1 hypothetical protein [Acinetobacter sp. S55]MBK0067484.1 hypothetical protein [Acinetobacter sp. S54]